MSVLSNFTKADRDASLPIIDKLLECAQIARQKGVLALEDNTKQQENEFLIFALMLVVDGVDPALIKGILETLISTENHTGIELLERILITEGVLSVQAGESPRLLEMKLLCFLGEDYLKQRGHFPIPAAGESIEHRINLLYRKKPAKWAENAEFGNTILKLENDFIQNVFRDIAQKDLTLAICGASEAAATKLMSNLSKRLALMILDDIKTFADQIQESEIQAAQEKMLDTIKKLAESINPQAGDGVIQITTGSGTAAFRR
ncbi:MAG: hypothetical protein FWC89_05125 [Defluviitaleaceae bacterium]|nr:hypothetical protein [Defluviitaleaceae bacterium]